MEERLISSKTSKLAKEKGFDEGTLFYYKKDNSLGKNSITLLQKWIREKRGVHIEILRKAMIYLKTLK